MTAPTQPPLLSPDGAFAWDGTQWLPVPPPMPVQVPPNADTLPQTGTILAEPAKKGFKKVKVIAGVSVLVVALGIGSFVAFGRGGSASDQTNDTSQAVAVTQPAQTPNEHCATEVYNAAADMVANGADVGDDGYSTEVQIGGFSDPVFHIAYNLAIEYTVNVNSSGKNAAGQRMSSDARLECQNANNPNQDSEGGPSGYTPGG